MPPKGHDLDVRVSFDPDYEDMVAEIISTALHGLDQPG